MNTKKPMKPTKVTLSMKLGREEAQPTGEHASEDAQPADPARDGPGFQDCEGEERDDDRPKERVARIVDDVSERSEGVRSDPDRRLRGAARVGVARHEFVGHGDRDEVCEIVTSVIPTTASTGARIITGPASRSAS
jgi:hypothetical protein